MKILFASEKVKSKRASHRLRGELTVRALQNLGYDAQTSNGITSDNCDANTVVVFLKNTQPHSIQRAKELGAFCFYDICDNKFEEKDEYIPCCQLADHISVSSEQMRSWVQHHTGRESIAIPEAFERPELIAKFNPGPTIKLLWFGSSASLKFVDWVTLWSRLETEIGNYEMTIVTAKSERIQNKMTSRSRSVEYKNVNLSKIKFVEWTWEAQGQALAETDCVLIPVGESYRTETKSANRVVDSLISGRYVITSPLQSYEEFAAYTWQQDYIEGIKYAIANPSIVETQIKLGQAHVREHYAPEVIARRWLEAFDAVR